MIKSLALEEAVRVDDKCHRLYFGILEDQLNKVSRIPALK